MKTTYSVILEEVRKAWLILDNSRVILRDEEDRIGTLEMQKRWKNVEKNDVKVLKRMLLRITKQTEAIEKYVDFCNGCD